MRLSWAHAAAGALTAVVAAGLLAMPSRLLGPDQARLTPISLPRAASTTVVVAARPVVKPRAKVVRRAAQPAPTAQLASVVVHPTVPTRTSARRSQGRPALGASRRGRPRDDPESRAAPPAAGRRAEGRPQARPHPGAGSCSCARSRTCSVPHPPPRRHRLPPRRRRLPPPRRHRHRPRAAPAAAPTSPTRVFAYTSSTTTADDLVRRSELPARRSPRQRPRQRARGTATTTGTTAATAATATSTGTATATKK